MHKKSKKKKMIPKTMKKSFKNDFKTKKKFFFLTKLYNFINNYMIKEIGIMKDVDRGQLRYIHISWFIRLCERYTNCGYSV